MRKMHYFNWQENAGYEDLRNQPDELQRRNKKTAADSSAKLNDTKGKNNDKSYIR